MLTPQQQQLRRVVARRDAGRASGIYAVYSANDYMLRAGFERTLADESPLL